MQNPDAPKHQPMPDCMMPDGAEPCAGFRYEATARSEALALFNKWHTIAAEQRAALEEIAALPDARADEAAGIARRALTSREGGSDANS